MSFQMSCHKDFKFSGKYKSVGNQSARDFFWFYFCFLFFVKVHVGHVAGHHLHSS